MDIPAPPLRTLDKPFVLHLGFIVILGALCIGIGYLTCSLYANEQILLTRARSLTNALIRMGNELANQGEIPKAASAGSVETDGAGESYHMFSQTPVNPANLPDDFERQAMTQFQNGAKESSTRVLADGQVWFRYAHPLVVDASYLAGHADQGYILGEQRGGISVSFAVTGNEKQMAIQFFFLTCLSLAAISLTVLIPWQMRRHSIRTVNQMEARLAEMAATDELTGLANRRYFFRRFDEEFSRALRHERSLAILMIDIDHFKLVNDYYGHQVGDQALQLLSSLLKANCRLSDLVARYGGEEFVILLPEIDLKGAQVLAEKLRTTVASASVKLSQQQQAERPGAAALGSTTTRFEPDILRFTISLGLACLDAPQLKELALPTRLVALADAALYQAKHTGRNRVTVHQ